LVYLILQPIEIREAIPNRAKKLDSINFINFSSNERSNSTYRIANAIESGRAVARDIGGSDPERMSAPNVASYVQQLFQNSSVKVEIISDTKTIEKDFPCLGILQIIFSILNQFIIFLVEFNVFHNQINHILNLFY